MPQLDALQVPPPANWQDFEALCCDLWRKIWDDPGTQQHGREGQPQQGVDVFGRPRRGALWAGVQCKLRSQIKGSRLTSREICGEVVKARDFNPKLAEFIIATTAERDAKAQAAAREISRVQASDDSFSVSVFAWEDIVQRLLEHRDVVEKHYPYLADGKAASLDEIRTDYLAALWDELYPVPLRGVGRSRGEDIPLAAVYTALDVGTTLLSAPLREEITGETYADYLLKRLQKEGEAQEASSGRELETHGRHMMAIEAAAAHPRLVLLGPAGSGKSTFVRYLALCLTGELLHRTEANLKSLEGGDGEDSGIELPAWVKGAILPIFVELRKFVRSEAFPNPEQKGKADHLLAYLDAREPAKLDTAGMLKDTLKRQGALLILDGLDETPAATKSRERLKQTIISFCRRFPECRVIVTCRPYAYEAQSPWRLDSEDFAEESLRPFDPAKREAFIKGWYAFLVRRRQVGAEQAERSSAGLIREIEASDYLKPLAERPLMLTLMTDLHAACGGRLPGGRAGLYEESVKLLLDRWNEVRDVLGGKGLSEHLGMSDQRVRKALESLAYQVHRERGAEAQGAAEITDVELWKALNTQRPDPEDSKVDERQVRDYLHQRSGILIGESPELYRFPHRSFQEYLAACHLTRHSFPRLLLREVQADPTLWREVTLLAAGKVAETPFMVWALLEGLVPENPAAPVVAEDPGFLRALYAGLAIQESELWRDVEEEDGAKLERIRKWLECALDVEALSPVDRAAGGRVLALLGDQRDGVSLRDDGIPDIEWVSVPAGSFRMGSSKDDEPAFWDGKPQHEVELDSFEISRYPVTNAQYRAFVKDGGYGRSGRIWWSEAGWEWKKERKGPNDDLPADQRLPNHPRVNVSWYEAEAFSRWLGHQLGADIRLPTEAEWEKASRGTDGRRYPWGDEFDETRCNVIHTRIGQPSSVGMFPSGASPYGAADMSGNVWEWTLSVWSEDYKDRQNGIDAAASHREVEEAKSASGARVVRGGGCWGDAGDARCATHGRGGPQTADVNLGFRVLLPAPQS